MQTRQWGIEYARDGIRVVSVSPGAIDTPLVRASLDEQGGGDALANRHPVGRIGRGEEVASALRPRMDALRLRPVVRVE